MFLDIEKAYDSVWQEALLLKIYNAGITGAPWRFIRCFLQNRRFRVLHSLTDDTSDWHTISAGVPQGCVLSPLLFLLFINDIFTLASPQLQQLVQPLLFADDIALVPTRHPHSTLDSFFHSLTAALDVINSWSNVWRVRFSFSKSALVLFSTQRTVPPPPSLTIGNFIIQQQTQYKYLGVMFDSDCSHRSQAKHVISKTRAASFVVCNLLTSYFSPSLVIIRHLIHSIIISTLSYGLIFWRPTDLQMNELDNLILKPFYKFGELPHSTHKHSISTEFNTPLTSHLRHIQHIRFARRLHTLHAHHPSAQLFHHQQQYHIHPTQKYTNFYTFYKYTRYLYLTQYLTHCPRASATLLTRASHIRTKSDVNAVTDLVFLSLTTLHLNNITRNIIVNDMFTDESIGLKQFHHRQSYFTSYLLPSYITFDPIHLARLRARLRLNRANTNVYRHRLNAAIPPFCPHCAAPTLDTLTHIFLHCPQFTIQRNACLARLSPIFHVHHLSLPLIFAFFEEQRAHIIKSACQYTATFIAYIQSIRKL